MLLLEEVSGGGGVSTANQKKSSENINYSHVTEPKKTPRKKAAMKCRAFLAHLLYGLVVW